MKILFLDHSLELGGAELSLIDILTPPNQILSKVERLAVTFGEGKFTKALSAQSIPFITIHANPGFLGVKRDGGLFGALAGLISAIRIARKIKSRVGKFDVIHCNTQKSFVVGCALGIISRKPVFWHLRDILAKEHFSRVQILLVVLLARFCATQILANSQATADAYVAAGGARTQTRVIYNGISIPDSFSSKSALLTQIPENAILMGVFSRISRWKGQELAIRVTAKIPNSHLLIVGAPLFGEDEYERSLKDLVKELKIANRVHFLGFQNDVWPLMRACRYILHTSIEAEPFGRVIVEGMLCEKIVFAPNAGGPREILDHLKTGVLYEANSVESLAGWISRIDSDPDLHKRIQKDAVLSANARFSRDRMVQETYEALGVR